MPMNERGEILYDRLTPVGKMMFDSARVFAAGGRHIPDEYIQRILLQESPHA